MDIDIRIKEIINLKLSQYNLGDYDSLRPKLQEQLVQIELYIQQIIIEQDQIALKIKEFSKLNLLSVSEGAKVQRSTIYNNPNTLKSYIEQSINEIQRKDVLRINEIEKIKQKNKELSSCLEGFQQRIVENHVLLLKISELESELKSLNSINEDLNKQVNSLIVEKQKITRQSSRIQREM